MRGFPAFVGFVALVAGLFLAASVHAVDLDLDHDGRSDIVIVDINQSGLDWAAALASAGFAQSTTLGTLGENGNMLTPGAWSASGAFEISVASYDSAEDKVNVTVSTGNSSATVEAGSGGDLIIAGGDYDGNGIYDLASVDTAGAAAVKLNPFGGAGQNTQLNFAASAANGAEGLFINRTGSGDEIGLLKTRTSGAIRRYTLRTLNLQGRSFSKSFRSSSRYSLEDVVSISQSGGSDSILFFEKRGSRRRVLVFNMAGTRQYLGNTGRGTLLVGDYSSAPGEEFAVYRNGVLKVVNPFNSAKETLSGLPSGVPADHVNVNKFESSGGGDGGGDDDGGGGGDVLGCATIREFPRSTHLYKTIGSEHFHDVRRNTIGLLMKPGASGPFPSCVPVLDTAGTQIGAVSLYQRGNGWAARYYAGIGCASSYAFNGARFAAIARANTGSPNILFHFGSFCIGPINAAVCIGSSQC